MLRVRNTQLAPVRHQRTAAFQRHRDVEHDEITEIDQLLDVLRADIERPFHAFHIRQRTAARSMQLRGNFGGGSIAVSKRDEVRSDAAVQFAALTSTLSLLKPPGARSVPRHLISGG